MVAGRPARSPARLLRRRSRELPKRRYRLLPIFPERDLGFRKNEATKDDIVFCSGGSKPNRTATPNRATTLQPPPHCSHRRAAAHRHTAATAAAQHTDNKTHPTCRFGQTGPQGYCVSSTADNSPRYHRDMAQLGSALRSGRRGRRFKSCYPDQHNPPSEAGFRIR